MKTPTDAKARKAIPLATGLLDYFPKALLAVAELSRIGNDQHNPGQPLHWAREKSTDHADCIMRHMVDRGQLDTDGVLHDAKVAWRALAQLELAIEALAIAQVKEAYYKPGGITRAVYRLGEDGYKWLLPDRRSDTDRRARPWTSAGAEKNGFRRSRWSDRRQKESPAT